MDNEEQPRIGTWAWHIMHTTRVKIRAAPTAYRPAKSWKVLHTNIVLLERDLFNASALERSPCYTMERVHGRVIAKG